MPTHPSRKALVDWASNSVAFYGIDIARISTVFLSQALSLQVNRVFNTSNLTQPIKVLEGLIDSSTTGPAEPFKHQPLKGLYKKHFNSPRFLPTNISTFSKSKLGKRHFQGLWDEAMQASKTGIDYEELAKCAYHHMVFASLKIKMESQSMTGEWIIFDEHEGKKYYLTLASHCEDDTAIYDRAVLASKIDGFPLALRTI